MEYRNIAIIAHVDHGKTTLVDGMLRQSKIFSAHQKIVERVMDSNDLEKERGITILSKNTAIEWQGVKINIVDTPGHTDFGGEVERGLNMVDGVLILVDAAEGPMPQTRFVMKKALAKGLKPIVVINKIDRNDARPEEVVNMTFDLMADLDANEDQLDFPILYAIARDGKAWLQDEEESEGLSSLFNAIIEHIPAADAETEKPFLFQVANLDYSDYIGRIAVGRVYQGKAKKGDIVNHLQANDLRTKAKITKIFTHYGLDKINVEEISAGDIVALAGLENVQIGDTLTSSDELQALATITVDEPTVSVTFSPNTSPFAGQEGKYVTSRHIFNRLERELLSNVALRVESLGNESYRVSGRGELHLSILMEEMRREGYEFSVSRPEVIMKEVNGKLHEPYEHLIADVPTKDVGVVIESLSKRKGNLLNMSPSQGDRSRLEFSIPSRALFGYRTQFLSMTRGEGILNHTLDGYEPYAGEIVSQHGSLVSMENGEAFAYSLFKLQDRGLFFITPGTKVYAGMIIGANAKTQDLDINVCKNKKLSAVRTAHKDENMILTPAKILTLEEALEYISKDELVEITPTSIRLRKKILDLNLRKRTNKAEKVQ